MPDGDRVQIPPRMIIPPGPEPTVPGPFLACGPSIHLSTIATFQTSTKALLDVTAPAAQVTEVPGLSAYPGRMGHQRDAPQALQGPVCGHRLGRHWTSQPEALTAIQRGSSSPELGLPYPAKGKARRPSPLPLRPSSKTGEIISKMWSGALHPHVQAGTLGIALTDTATARNSPGSSHLGSTPPPCPPFLRLPEAWGVPQPRAPKPRDVSHPQALLSLGVGTPRWRSPTPHLPQILGMLSQVLLSLKDLQHHVSPPSTGSRISPG